MAGVCGTEHAAIKDIIGFTLGSFPFRYLGIPLAAAKLRADYTPLFEKISELIKAWTSLTILYAGMLELLRSVIQCVSCYWLAICPIPSIIMATSILG